MKRYVFEIHDNWLDHRRALINHHIRSTTVPMLEHSENSLAIPVLWDLST